MKLFAILPVLCLGIAVPQIVANAIPEEETEVVEERQGGPAEVTLLVTLLTTAGAQYMAIKTYAGNGCWPRDIDAHITSKYRTQLY